MSISAAGICPPNDESTPFLLDKVCPQAFLDRRGVPGRKIELAHGVDAYLLHLKLN